MSAIGGDTKEDVGGCAAQISIKFSILAAENGARGNMEVSLGDVYILVTTSKTHYTGQWNCRKNILPPFRNIRCFSFMK
jgi:hypothetical protein